MQKTFYLLLTLSLFCVSAQAQDDEFQYLFGQRDLSFSGFGGSIHEVSFIDGELAYSNGGGGALLINQKFFVGGYGMGLTSTHQLPQLNHSNYEIDFGHGGLWIGYIHKHKEVIHFGGSLKLGGGQISISEYKDWNKEYANDNIFVINPMIEAEMNITSWFKINVGAGYRLVGGVNNNKVSSVNGQVFNGFKGRDFSGSNINIGFLFGFFK